MICVVRVLVQKSICTFNLITLVDGQVDETQVLISTK